MDQYHPYGDAYRYPEIAQPLTPEEFEEALEATRKAGIHRLDRDIGRRFRLW